MDGLPETAGSQADAMDGLPETAGSQANVAASKPSSGGCKRSYRVIQDKVLPGTSDKEPFFGFRKEQFTCPGRNWCQFKTLELATAFCDQEETCVAVQQDQASQLLPECEGSFGCYFPGKGELAKSGSWADSGGKTHTKGNCEVLCVWGHWHDWSACSTTCGAGARKRKRFFEANVEFSSPCEGNDLDSANCTVKDCPAPCRWSTWGDWGSCSKECGGGERHRSRAQANSSSACTTETQPETGKCASQHCPTDCIWRSWTEWNVCTKTCGGGVHKRRREKAQHESLGGHCQGNATEDGPCGLKICLPDYMFTTSPPSREAKKPSPKKMAQFHHAFGGYHSLLRRALQGLCVVCVFIAIWIIVRRKKDAEEDALPPEPLEDPDWKPSMPGYRIGGENDFRQRLAHGEFSDDSSSDGTASETDGGDCSRPETERASEIFLGGARSSSSTQPMRRTVQFDT